MKNLIICLALLSAAVFTACQENPLMDNPQNVDQQNYSTNKTSATENIIKLDGLLIDPRQGLGNNISYTLTGDVVYSLRYHPDHVISVQKLNNITLRLKIDAKLIRLNDQNKLPNYSIKAESFDRLNIPFGGSRTVLLVKKYSITGFPKVHLKCIYEVSTTSVTIKEMKLCCNVITQHANVSQY